MDGLALGCSGLAGLGATFTKGQGLAGEPVILCNGGLDCVSDFDTASFGLARERGWLCSTPHQAIASGFVRHGRHVCMYPMYTRHGISKKKKKESVP